MTKSNRLLQCTLGLLYLLTGFALAQDAVVYETNADPIRVVTLVEGLDSPWSFVILPDGDMLVTERSGQLRRIHDGRLQGEPISGVPAIRLRNHSGIMDVTLHPQFASNQLVYLTYSKTRGDEATTAVWRARLQGNALVDGADIFVADAWSPRDLNFGSRAVFGNDGMLYVSVGDRGPDGEPLSQDLGNHNGTINRLYDDGRIPQDNPFVGVAGAKPEIWSYGHRNPQGMLLHPDTGEIWASEHGPMGGDEVNIIKRGANYGWPLVSFGRKYSGEAIADSPVREGIEAPAWFWVPSIGISNIMIYTGDAFPAWKGQLIVSGMSGRMIQRVRQGGSGSSERESLLTQLRHEIRDLRQGPDGLLYVLSRQNGVRDPASGTLFRIEPVSTVD